jgi:preprotein translocase subunit SecA
MMFRLQRFQSEAKAIVRRADQLQNQSEADLMALARKLTRKARPGTKLKLLLPEVFALGIEASFRTLGLRHYPVQVVGAIALFRRRIVEVDGETVFF